MLLFCYPLLCNFTVCNNRVNRLISRGGGGGETPYIKGGNDRQIFGKETTLLAPVIIFSDQYPETLIGSIFAAFSSPVYVSSSSSSRDFT